MRTPSSNDQPAMSRILVTGGGDGIGRAIALALANTNTRVAVLDVNSDTAQQVVQEITARGCTAIALQGSVADLQDVRRAFEAIDKAWGGIDVLVNNAGITGNKAVLDLSPEDWNRVVSINLNGVFYCSQEAGRRMKMQGAGCIVNLSSIYGVVAAPNRLAYCATKAAVAMMTKTLAIEWADAGIRVNAVAPGYVETPSTAELVAAGRLDVAAIEKRTPLGRLAQPEEIADAVKYLTANTSAYITGQILGVDGGWTAYGYI